MYGTAKSRPERSAGRLIEGRKLHGDHSYDSSGWPGAANRVGRNCCKMKPEIAKADGEFHFGKRADGGRVPPGDFFRNSATQTYIGIEGNRSQGNERGGKNRGARKRRERLFREGSARGRRGILVGFLVSGCAEFGDSRQATGYGHAAGGAA